MNFEPPAEEPRRRARRVVVPVRAGISKATAFEKSGNRGSRRFALGSGAHLGKSGRDHRAAPKGCAIPPGVAAVALLDCKEHFLS